MVMSSNPGSNAMPPRAVNGVHAKISRIARCIMCVSLGGTVLLAPMGCATTPSAPAAKTTLESGKSGDNVSAARDALDQILRAYESGESVEPFLVSSMTGMQSLLDSIRDSQNQQKQIRVFLKDVQPTLGADLVVIHASWEKRYLALPGMSPKLATGQASFQMRQAANGWRLSGMSGDNLFAAK